MISKFSEGWSTRAISEWLQNEHGVQASYGSVARLLKTHREELAAETRQVARDKLAPSIESDIDGFDALLSRLKEAEEECRDAGMMKERLKALELQFRIHDRKLHYAGAGEANTVGSLSELMGLAFEE